MWIFLLVLETTALDSEWKVELSYSESPTKLSSILSFFLFLFSFGLFSTAYGGSQARCLIGVMAASLHHSHSHAGSESCL